MKDILKFAGSYMAAFGTVNVIYNTGVNIIDAIPAGKFAKICMHLGLFTVSTCAGVATKFAFDFVADSMYETLKDIPKLFART